jgi:hypothetical protein
MSDVTDTFAQPPDQPGPHLTRIGHYTIRRVIASGGMGTVYEALQEQPRRTVAVKLMKHGVASAAALRRFEFESQLLARLKHPGIAEVYEAGTHDDGTGPVPFFAMEYVPNAAPITAYAKSRGLGVQQRIELFTQVCDAVHHGHQKGIIHRDLKPDNIIVDAEGRPKVIDFGVARATDSDLAFATLQTEYGQLIGTLQYMSPEQVSADPHDIDIRSDVYALGVVLYELLAGRLPYDLKETPPLEAARRIRDEAPPNLSTTSRLLGGDLVTIAHKALDKDRERRYQSAGELAADLRRFLNREPISARPPTVLYQVKVFARRNKVLVGSMAAVLVVLLAGGITSTALYVKAERQRAEADRQARRSLAAIGFVTDLVHSASDENWGEDLKIGDLLDRYGEKVGTAFPENPEIEAAVRIALTDSYLFLNDFEKAGGSQRYLRAARDHMERAIELRREAFGELHPETLEALSKYAAVLSHEGDHAAVTRISRRLADAWRQLKGEHDPVTISATEDLAYALAQEGKTDEALRIQRAARDLSATVLGDSSQTTRRCQLRVAEYARAKGAFQESEQLCQSVIDTRDPMRPAPSLEGDPAVRQLAATFLAQGKVSDAASLYGNRRVPERLQPAQWLQGNANPADGRPTVVVHLAEWCPYTHRAMPDFLKRVDRFTPKGIQVIGLVQGEEPNPKRAEFLRSWKIGFPVGIEGRDMTEFYRLGGFPMAALVVSNYVVWQGNIVELDDATLQGIAAGVRRGAVAASAAG